VDGGPGSARKVFQRPGPGQGAGDHRPLLEIPSSHLSLRRTGFCGPVPRLGRTDPGTCLLCSDLSSANRSIKKRGSRPGKGVWRRIPAIQSEHLVLTVQRMAETLFHEVGEYSGHRGLSGGSTSRGFVYLLSRECRSQWKRTARAAIACFSISPAQIPPACRL